MSLLQKEISICGKEHTYRGQWSDTYLSWTRLQIYSSTICSLCCIRLNELHFKALEGKKVSVHGPKCYFCSFHQNSNTIFLNMPRSKYRPGMWQGPENNEKKLKGKDFNALFKLCLFSSGFLFKFLSTTTILSAVGIIHVWVTENPRPEQGKLEIQRKKSFWKFNSCLIVLLVFLEWQKIKFVLKREKENNARKNK